MITESEATGTVGQLLAELREAQATREDAERRIVGLRKLVDGYLELYPLLESLVATGDLDEEGPPERPRGMEAPLKILRDRSGNWYTVATIVEQLERSNWLPRSSNPRNAVRTALERLVEMGTIRKGRALGSGAVIYAFMPPPVDDETDDDEREEGPSEPFYGDEEPF